MLLSLAISFEGRNFQAASWIASWVANLVQLQYRSIIMDQLICNFTHKNECYSTLTLQAETWFVESHCKGVFTKESLNWEIFHWVIPLKIPFKRVLLRCFPQVLWLHWIFLKPKTSFGVGAFSTQPQLSPHLTRRSAIHIIPQDW